MQSDIVSGPGAQRLAFSTEALPGADRLAVWREVFGRQVAHLDITPVDPHRPIMAEVGVRVLPGASISYGVNRNVRSRRTPDLIKDGSDDLLFGFVESGTIAISQAEREIRFAAGAATLAWNALPSSAEAAEEVRLYNINIPYRSLAARVKHVEGHCARVISDTNPALQLLNAYAQKVFSCSDAELTAEFASLAGAHIVDLVSLVLGATGDSADLARARGLRVARLTAAKGEVARNLFRPDLSAEMIAANLQISTSYLRKLFDLEDTTFGEYVLNARLAQAYRLLSDPARPAIGTIAYAVGFSDLSHFNRRFRRRFGGSPREIRDEILKGRG